MSELKLNILAGYRPAKVYRLGRARFGVNPRERYYDALIPLPFGFGIYASHSPGDMTSVHLRSWQWARFDFYDVGLRADTRQGHSALKFRAGSVRPLADRWDESGRGLWMHVHKAARA